MEDAPLETMEESLSITLCVRGLFEGGGSSSPLWQYETHGWVFHHQQRVRKVQTVISLKGFDKQCFKLIQSDGHSVWEPNDFLSALCVFFYVSNKKINIRYS